MEFLLGLTTDALRSHHLRFLDNSGAHRGVNALAPSEAAMRSLNNTLSGTVASA
jgi:hypothetical protein